MTNFELMQWEDDGGMIAIDPPHEVTIPSPVNHHMPGPGIGDFYDYEPTEFEVAI